MVITLCQLLPCKCQQLDDLYSLGEVTECIQISKHIFEMFCEHKKQKGSVALSFE